MYSAFLYLTGYRIWQTDYRISGQSYATAITLKLTEIVHMLLFVMNNINKQWNP